MHSLGTSCRGISCQETNDLLSMIRFNFVFGIKRNDAEGYDEMQYNFVQHHIRRNISYIMIDYSKV